MNWPDALAQLNQVELNTFGLVACGISPVLVPQDGSGEQPIDGVPLRSPQEEDYVIGAANAPTVVHLQVMTELVVRVPVRGDIITIGANNYIVRDIEVPPDPEDGAVVFRLVKVSPGA